MLLFFFRFPGASLVSLSSPLSTPYASQLISYAARKGNQHHFTHSLHGFNDCEASHHTEQFFWFWKLFWHGYCNKGRSSRKLFNYAKFWKIIWSKFFWNFGSFLCLYLQAIKVLYISSKQPRLTPGGVLRFGFDGSVQLTPQNTYPLLGVILAKNSTHL